MAYVIEKNVPVPAGGRPLNTESLTGVMRRMQIGDSLLIAGRTNASLGSHRQMLAPKKYAARKVEGGVRVWRIE